MKKVGKMASPDAEAVSNMDASIGGIVLLSFDERLHISRRDEPHLMPETL